MTAPDPSAPLRVAVSPARERVLCVLRGVAVLDVGDVVLAEHAPDEALRRAWDGCRRPKLLVDLLNRDGLRDRANRALDLWRAESHASLRGGVREDYDVYYARVADVIRAAVPCPTFAEIEGAR